MAEPVKVVQLLYRREGKTDLFSGTIQSDQGDCPFSSATFNAILTLASEVLKAHPEHRLLFKREEAPYPMVLPENIENLLRTDLPAAIEALTISPQRIVVGVPKMDKEPVLRHGYDTLSDALGDRVYIKYRNPSPDSVQLEDPITGRWVTAMRTVPGVVAYNGMVYNLVVASMQLWCTVSLETLLNLGKTRYYLPRGWNPSGGWITYESLMQMFETYQKEKQDVSRS